MVSTKQPSNNSRTVKKDERPDWLKQSHGKDCDCMVCHDYKPDLHRPQYLGREGYQCPDCKRKFIRFKACNLHMGRVPNVMGSCKGTPLA